MIKTAGVILIDKPVGPSSFEVVRKVRKLAGIKSVGHAGTLDPMASGLLVVCLGVYTKLAGILTEDNKIYETTFRFGARTATDDTEGEIIEQHDIASLVEDEIIAALAKMRGIIMQAPPRFSAIKIEGKRAYAKARAHEDFEIAKRSVEIFNIDNIKLALPDISFCIHCSKGFYVRAFARDLGEMFGVSAHATSIRRIASGGFSVNNAIAVDKLTIDNFSEHIIRGKAALSNLEIIEIDSNTKRELTFGRNACAHVPLSAPVAIAVHEDVPIAILRKVLGKTLIARIF